MIQTSVMKEYIFVEVHNSVSAYCEIVSAYKMYLVLKLIKYGMKLRKIDNCWQGFFWCTLNNMVSSVATSETSGNAFLFIFIVSCRVYTYSFVFLIGTSLIQWEMKHQIENILSNWLKEDQKLIKRIRNVKAL